MRSWRREPKSWHDWLLVALIGVYFLLVALVTLGPSSHASVDAIGDGRVWVLSTSALDVTGSVRGVQVVVLLALTVAVVLREGPGVWWVVALCGHIGSALIAYGLIGIAILLGSGSADHVADDPDFGVSCVMAALFGALGASGAEGVRREGGPRGADRAALAVGLVGLVVVIPFSFGWYGVEHPLAWAIGATVTWVVVRRRPAATVSDARAL